jgi:DMSO/TMAO reductase YedYZ molybdopterin-dependent catalytic subunit
MTAQTVSKASGRRPGWLTGALIGLLVLAPLIALLFLGDVLFGLPLLPLDLLDWLARILPGGILTATIDSIVALNGTLNLGRTDQFAKAVEQIMAVGMLAGIGIVGGAGLFAIFNRVAKRAQNLTIGALIGALLGVALALISGSVNLTADTPGALNFVYLTLIFALWGAGVAYLYNDLTAIKAADASASAVQLNRRQFLVRVAGVTATLTVVGSGLSLLLGREESSTPVASTGDGTGGTAATPAPASDFVASPGEMIDDLVPASGTRPEYTPLAEHYRIDINARPPEITEADWALNITGLVSTPLALTLADLRENYTPQDQIVTLSCISNPVGGDLISTTRWTGVRFQTILDEAGVQAEGMYAKITGVDGFDEYLALDLVASDERVMLAYAWDGQPLEIKHGFPLRVYIPDLYGMKQPKWITGIEIVDAWGEGYWVRRGWSETAVINTTSVVDTVAVDDLYEGADGVQYVPVGGIAYAGARGISAVEVRVNDGEWVPATMKTPLSETAWVIWRYDWPFAEGAHVFEVRAVDGSGEPQIESARGVRPDGATGIDRLGARL